MWAKFPGSIKFTMDPGLQTLFHLHLIVKAALHLSVTGDQPLDHVLTFHLCSRPIWL